MAIAALGYIGVRSDKLDDWSDFAGNLLGMQKIDRGGRALAFRMDDKAQRLIVADEPGETLAFMGWEVEQRSDLDLYAARLETAGTRVAHAPKALADQRFVEEMVAFDDPMGNRVELFWKPMIASDPFVPGRPITGFKTGPMGMGHAVLHVRDVDVMLPFYRDMLDFRVSDYGLEPYGLYFFHVNKRHHSFAIVGSGRQGFHHFMVEFDHLDDVGQGYDLACLEQGRVAYTLGRHTNDYMTSFYAHTPSGFFVESGWGGRQIDPATWLPHETTGGPSFWGHERLHLAEDGGRKRLRDMRLELAKSGIRAPALVDCPWLYGEMAKLD
ncbi:MAG: VOC family protein [Pseudolabrys sp.]|nr:VOC family protein [Pseudolabrys sp.]MDP2295592.1 VOC family protein [Pseudolabrys sp.]